MIPRFDRYYASAMIYGPVMESKSERDSHSRDAPAMYVAIKCLHV